MQTAPTPSPDLRRILPYRRPRPDAKLRLVCLPFAGGSAGTYRTWGELLPASVDVCAVELPGHGVRIGEPPIPDADALTTALAQSLAPLFDRPLVLFGHSMGGRLAHALMQRVPRPAGMIMSASPAPHLRHPHHRSQMSEAELIESLRELGGTPPGVLDDPEIISLFLPVLRADFALLERGHARADAPVLAPLRILAARDDEEVPFADACAWSQLAAGEQRLAEMSGGHFYVTSQPERVLREVRAALADWKLLDG